MDYWKLLTEGPLHADEAAAAADLRNDSNNRLLRCDTLSFFLLLLTSVRNCLSHKCIVLNILYIAAYLSRTQFTSLMPTVFNVLVLKPCYAQAKDKSMPGFVTVRGAYCPISP